MFAGTQVHRSVDTEARTACLVTTPTVPGGGDFGCQGGVGRRRGTVASHSYDT